MMLYSAQYLWSNLSQLAALIGDNSVRAAQRCEFFEPVREMFHETQVLALRRFN